MAAKRTTPSMGRMIALLAGTAGIGFGSAAVAERHGPELPERSVRARVAERVAPPAGPRTRPTPKRRTARVAARPPKSRQAAAAPKPHRQPKPTSSAALAQASPPTLQAPAQVPAPATAAPATAAPATPAATSIVSGGS